MATKSRKSSASPKSPKNKSPRSIKSFESHRRGNSPRSKTGTPVSGVSDSMTPDILEVAKVVTMEGGKSSARSMSSKHSHSEDKSPITGDVKELLGEEKTVLSRQITPEKESIENENAVVSSNEMGAKLSREREVSGSLSQAHRAEVSQSSDSATPRPQSDASRATSRTLTPRRSDTDKDRKSNVSPNSASRESAKSRQEEELALDLNLRSGSERGGLSSRHSSVIRSSSRHSSVISPLKPMKSPQKGPVRVSSGGEGHSSAGARQSLQSRESERSSRVTLSRTSLASSMSARSLKSKTEYVEERKYLRSLQGDNSDYGIDLSAHSALSHSHSRAAASVKSDKAASVKSDRAASVKSDKAASVKSDRAVSVKSKKSSSRSSSSRSELEHDKRKSPGSHLSVRSKSRSKPVGMVGFELKDEVEVSYSSEEEKVVAAAGRLSSRKHLTPGSRPTSSASNKSRIMSAREYAQRSLSTDAAHHERDDSSDHYSDIFSSDDAAKTRNSDKSGAKSGANSARSDHSGGSPAKSNDTGGSPAAALEIEEEMRALEEKILPEVRGGEGTFAGTHDSGSSSDDSLFEAAKDLSSSGSEGPKSRASSHRSDRSIKSLRSNKVSRATSSRQGESSVSRATSGLSHARSAESRGASRKSGGDYSRASLKKSSVSNAYSSSDSEFEAARRHASGSETELIESRVSSRSSNDKSARPPSSKYTASSKSSASSRHSASSKSSAGSRHSASSKSSASSRHSVSRKSSAGSRHSASRKSSASSRHSVSSKSSASSRHSVSRKSSASSRHSVSRKSSASSRHSVSRKSSASSRHSVSRKSSASSRHSVSRKSSASSRHSATSKSSASQAIDRYSSSASQAIDRYSSSDSEEERSRVLTRSGLSHRSSEEDEELETVPPLPPIDDKPITAARDDPQPTVAVRKRPKMSRESTSIRALQIIRDQLRQIGGKKPTAKFSASLGPYRATEHVFEYINQPERATTGVVRSRPTVLELVGLSGSGSSSMDYGIERQLTAASITGIRPKEIPITEPLPPFPRLGAVVDYRSKVRGKLDYNQVSQVRSIIEHERRKRQESRTQAEYKLTRSTWARFQVGRIPSNNSTNHFLRAANSYFLSTGSHRALKEQFNT